MRGGMRLAPGPCSVFNKWVGGPQEEQDALLSLSLPVCLPKLGFGVGHDQCWPPLHAQRAAGTKGASKKDDLFVDVYCCSA